MDSCAANPELDSNYGPVSAKAQTPEEQELVSSGRVIATGCDAMDRVSQVSGSLGTQVTNYVGSISYARRPGLSTEQSHAPTERNDTDIFLKRTEPLTANPASPGQPRHAKFVSSLIALEITGANWVPIAKIQGL